MLLWTRALTVRLGFRHRRLFPLYCSRLQLCCSAPALRGIILSLAGTATSAPSRAHKPTFRLQAGLLSHQSCKHYLPRSRRSCLAAVFGEVGADVLSAGPAYPHYGHLTHMPSHTYIRVGRWHDAVVANQLALQADESQVKQWVEQALLPCATCQ